jgi:sporulation protein YlmC with PRC-barrel domain
MAVENTINEQGRARTDTPVSMERLGATSVIGRHIENAEGEELGKIEDLMVNVQKGDIEYIVVNFDSFLGIGGKLFAIPFSELKLNGAKKIFMLHRDREYLKQSPGFDKDHWPDTNNHSYFENVRMYYGSYLPPFP